MRQLRNAADVYLAVDEITERLSMAGQSQLATVLHHRMHRVAWTTREELFEELRAVLAAALAPSDLKLPQEIRTQMELVLAAIRDPAGLQ